MSTLTNPIKNDIATQRDIFRLAAVLYTNTSDTYSAVATQIEIVKCVFLNNSNKSLPLDEIITNLLDIFKYHISEDELLSILKRNGKIFLASTVDGFVEYRLSDSVYAEMLKQQGNNITFFVDAYITSHTISEHDKCRDAIYRYLYELTTTNINSYKILLIGKDQERFSDSELSVNVDELTAEERTWVQGFLDWDNNEKNIALGNIVFCCLEYCLLVNGDSPNKMLCNTIRNRDIYLDTNVIFRALGINGESRKRVVNAFLNKCKQARIKLIISSHTKREFQDAISYYISQIKNFPRGSVYLGMYENLSDYSIYSFYDNWLHEHPGMSLNYFSIYIKSLYIRFIEQYGIVDDVKIPDKVFHSEEFKTARNSYSSSIRAKKQELRHWCEDENYGYSKRDSHDASIIRHIELLREECNNEKDIFFVSSDKALRYWDMTRLGTDYPTVIYPSQLFLILIKLCGRSENDFDSFVSFINIRSKTHQLTPEKANIIVAGISTITEDIQAQRVLASAVFGEEFQNIIRNSNTDAELYQNVQTYSQNYLKAQLKDQDDTIAVLSEANTSKTATIDALRAEATKREETLLQKQDILVQKTRELEANREKICAFAEKKINFAFICKHYVLPVLVCLFWIITVVFIMLQFLFCDKDWNVIALFLDWLDITTFGKKVNDALYVIDLALCGFGCLITKEYFKNPFDKETCAQSKADMVDKYIKKNHLF